MADRAILWVTIALRSSPVVSVLETEGERERASVHIGHTLYDQPVSCDLWLFYDWLRIEPGSIVGVRFLLQQGCHELQARLEGSSYVNVDTNGWFELYFSNIREHRPEISGDQDFLLSAVLSSESGEYLLYFLGNFLSDEELEAIRGLDTYVKGSVV